MQHLLEKQLSSSSSLQTSVSCSPPAGVCDECASGRMSPRGMERCGGDWWRCGGGVKANAALLIVKRTVFYCSTFICHIMRDNKLSSCRCFPVKVRLCCQVSTVTVLCVSASSERCGEHVRSHGPSSSSPGFVRPADGCGAPLLHQTFAVLRQGKRPAAPDRWC